MLAVALTFAVPGQAGATENEEAVSVFYVGKDYYLSDIGFAEMDVAPFIENGRVFVPLRYLAYALGIE